MKYLYYLCQDIADSVRARRVDLIPPKRLRWFFGAGPFVEIGNQFVDLFVRLGGLKAEHSVLEVGSGIGRMAIALTRYLSKEHGRYEGFDIVPWAVKWCQNHIQRGYPQFRFTFADINNGLFNPKGKIQARNHVWAYEPNSFEFVFATSVFTHMLSDDVGHYLHEISRVLKPGGRCFLTFFLLNPESQATAKNIKIRFPFRLPGEGWATTSDLVEILVAYPETWVRQSMAAADLTILDPIAYGSWSGRPLLASFQDILVAEKK